MKATSRRLLVFLAAFFILCSLTSAMNPMLGGQSFKRCCKKAIIAQELGEEYKCGQKFREVEDGEEEQEPAKPIWVTFKWCKENCAGWQISQATKLSQFATPFVGFILPAIVFGFVIPRRLKLEVSEHLFEFEFSLHWRDIIKGIIAFFGAAPFVLLDTLGWISAIFTMIGPMLLGGLHEAMIDSKIITFLEQDNALGSAAHEKITLLQKSEILLNMLVGNIDQDYGGAREDAKMIYTQVMDKGGRRITMARYMAMLKSQATFGGAVGAPVLFYAGAFAYGLIEIRARLGDNDTSHSLGFGMVCHFTRSK
jgi:hypothetical protein